MHKNKLFCLMVVLIFSIVLVTGCINNQKTDKTDGKAKITIEDNTNSKSKNSKETSGEILIEDLGTI